MDILKMIGVGIITAITAGFLRASKPELSYAVTIVGVLVILLSVVDMLQYSLSIFTTITEMTGVNQSLIKILLKIVGVGYLTEFGAGILQDFGSQSIADKIVLAGKTTIVLLSLPVIESLLSLMKSFLGLL